MMSVTKFAEQHAEDLADIARAVRLLSLDAVFAARSGHIGLPLGAAEIGTLLYFAVMHHNPEDPHWQDRDRFVLSAGHGSMLLYSLLHLAGYPLPISEIKRFRQFGSQTPGHPEVGHTPGVECTTGPLGQGLAHAVGMSLAERMLAARFNETPKYPPLVDHRTFVLAGDGCLMEGVSAEASSLAGHFRLNRLVVLYDANNITIDSATDATFTESVIKRYEAYGWNVLQADGHQFLSLARSMDKALEFANLPNGETGPTLIICQTTAGKGLARWQGTPKAHGNPLAAEDIAQAKKELGISDATPFLIPESCLQAAKKLIKTRREKALLWPERLAETKRRWEKTDDARLSLWDELIERKQGNSLRSVVHSCDSSQNIATRTAWGRALCKFAAIDRSLVGGSADLAGSTLSTIANSPFITPTDFAGRNIRFGVREHGMAAICNGITLHGGLRAYCSTFTVFSDYMRPALRLAALMKTPTLFIFSHDSYAVGEDGPTHQPIEHAAALRAIPDLQVFRPADALETVLAWEKALETTDKPTVLLLTRQDVENLDSLLPVPRTHECVREGLRQGASLVKDFSMTTTAGVQKIVLVAAGSEVSLALHAAKKLEEGSFETANGEKKNLSVCVLSAPAPQLLYSHPLCLNRLLPVHLPLFAIEAGCSQGWEGLVGRKGAVFALHSFGLSAPADALAKHFGLTAEQIAVFVLNQLAWRPCSHVLL